MLSNDRRIGHVLDRMRTLCSRREYCTDDIRKKVAGDLSKSSASLSENEITAGVEVVISELKKDKYLDDLRYSVAFARDKAQISGWGAAKIRYALGAKRIGREIVDEALSGIDSGRASDRLEKLLANKYGSLKGDPSWKVKLLRFAVGRGYGYDEANRAISRISSGRD